MKWISDPIDLKIRKKNDPNEQIVIFRHTQKILVRMKAFLSFVLI
jgi:hypothetical protein